MRSMSNLLAGFLLAATAVSAVAQGPVPAPAPTRPAPAPEPAAVATPAAADAAVPALTRSDVEAWIDGFLPYALAAGDIAGAVVVVVKDGQVLLQKGYGYADLAKKTPVDPQHTLFRPGSVSKLFTWTAVMQLVERGKLDLDADVSQYIDFDIPSRDGKPVTLRQIMTHTAGFEEQIRALIITDPEKILPLETALKRWVPERIHVPDTTPAYSNYATALAGYIVQRVSGEPFDVYVDRHIFEPLGMTRSSFSQPLPPALMENMSKGYAKASEGKPRKYEYISLAPAGSMAATGADMARFMIAHLQEGVFGDARILNAETARQMHSAGRAAEGPLNKMMLGFYETSVNGHRAIAHGGDTSWFHSDLQLFIDDGVGIFVSMNSAGRDGATLQIRNALMRGFANRYFPAPPASPRAVSAEDAKLHAQQLAGTYVSSRRPETSFLSLVNMLGPVKVVPNEDGTVSASLDLGPAGVPRKWREVAPYVWQDTAGVDRLAAEVTDGRVTRFSLEPYAPIMVFDRVAWWKSPALLLPLMVVSLAALLLTVLAWPVSALVRRHYGVPYRLSGTDARAHRVVRLAALAVLVSVGAMLGFIVAMFGDLELTGNSDALIIGLRLLATVVLPLGALLALWYAWQVLRSRRRWFAKLWAIVLALSCLFLFWLGITTHVIGFGANY